jgi:hypothetical protein
MLGMIGLVYQMVRHLRDWTVVMLLFFFTGMAIVIYLNQTPYQPRNGTMPMWARSMRSRFGSALGVFALYDAARSMTQKDLGMA